MQMNEELFDNIINTAQDCVFWKDKDRRFVGVNQAFLDFYGFDSADVLIGKNDEDMGWHSDPEPYKQDELRVLAGHSTYKVLGKCMVRGEERDIVASKRPIYDGGKIVGLVGSFIDVTAVVRKSAASAGVRTIYTIEKLRKIPFFDKLLDDTPLEDLLDPLTGVISRGFFLNFARFLISSGKPFTFVIADLDNFKYINDTYGHSAGDHALSAVARGLAEVVKDNGLVGRFGGDELLLINFKDLDYDSKKSFFDSIYHEGGVFRTTLNIQKSNLFITATAGCATYPSDADTYDQLFALTDKTLYCGKSKGRNCYVIYREDQHKDLDIRKLVKHGLYNGMTNLMPHLEQVSGFENRLLSIKNLLQNELNISEMFYVGKGLKLRSMIDRSLSLDVSDIENVMDGEICTERDNTVIQKKSPKLFEVLSEMKVKSPLIVRIGLNSETDGYLVCAGGRSERLWQEDECGILYFVAKTLAGYIRLSNEKIPD